MPNISVAMLGNGSTPAKTHRAATRTTTKKTKPRVRDHAFTLGIEEEFQIIDPETRELRSHIQQILADGKVLLKEHVKAEMHQSVVELGTPICQDIHDARRQVIALRSELAGIAEIEGLKIASAGTHPFSHWMDQLISPDERYATILNDMQQIARANLIWGLHVHVGIPDREEAIDVMNQARYFLPHLYALSVNSPFWLGQNTGLKAYRQMIFERFPRTGIPDAFESLSEYDDYLKLLVATGCIDNAKKIWWDIRLHPFFNTIEFRICDAQSRVDDTIALAALMQAIVVKLHKLRAQNVTFRSYPRRLIDENRWRAARYGLDGKLIDFGRCCEVDERDLLHEMIAFIATEVDELGLHREIAHVDKILREGTGADRQLRAWEENSHDLKAVVDHIVGETYEGLTVGCKVPDRGTVAA
ncbi:MAG TPA: carboxylate-amine ligase [Chthoniobacterales bacterium]|nr:carboxylate-amine ligase [Chthoniobacterales bacterium]